MGIKSISDWEEVFEVNLFHGQSCGSIYYLFDVSVLATSGQTTSRFDDTSGQTTLRFDVTFRRHVWTNNVTFRRHVWTKDVTFRRHVWTKDVTFRRHVWRNDVTFRRHVLLDTSVQHGQLNSRSVADTVCCLK